MIQPTITTSSKPPRISIGRRSGWYWDGGLPGGSGWLDTARADYATANRCAGLASGLEKWTV
jgi:hypothetical protein